MPNKTDPAPQQIRQMYEDDGLQLKEILRESPEAVNWLPDSTRGSNASGLLLVSESAAREVTGLIVVRQTADEAEILNIAVRRASRRSGIATQLLRAAVATLCERNATRLFLEVRESNVPAIAFYQKHAFRQVGRRPNYYRQPDEAALILERKLTG